MPKTIISDTSCLILLDNINELDLLQKLFGEIVTTPEKLLKNLAKLFPAFLLYNNQKTKFINP